MFQLLFKLILNLLATLLQTLLIIPNAIISNALPDLSSKILEVTQTITSMVGNITWALGIIPAPVIAALLFIITLEIAKHSIYVLTHMFLKVWEVIQKIKFW